MKKQPYTIKELARLYRALRDRKARVEAQAKAEKKRLDEDMELLAKLMDVYLSELQHTTGKTTIPTEYGTVYRQDKVKFSLADRGAFMDFVLDDPTEALKLLTNAVSSSEVKEYMANLRQKLEANGVTDEKELAEDNLLPPGIEARHFHEVVLRVK